MTATAPATVLAFPSHPVYAALERSGVLGLSIDTPPDDARGKLLALREELAGADALTVALAREHVLRLLRELGYADAPTLLMATLGRPAALGVPAVRGSGDLEPTYPAVLTMRELSERPELMAAPHVVVPRFAYSDSLTTVSGLPKYSGKSTLLSAAAAAVSRGDRFLDGQCPAGDVLWWSADRETAARLMTRLDGFGADWDRVHIVVRQPDSVYAFLQLLRERPYVFAVIDTLAPAVAAIVSHAGSADEWLAPLDALRATCQDTHCAIVLAHHAPRSDPSRPRDSDAIEGASDLVAGLTAVAGDPNRRTVTVRARWATEDFAVALNGNRYELANVAPSLDAQVLAVVVAQPGISGNGACAALKAHRADVLASIKRLAIAETIVNRGSSRNPSWHPATDQSHEVVPVVPVPPGTAKVVCGTTPKGGTTTTASTVPVEEIPPARYHPNGEAGDAEHVVDDPQPARAGEAEVQALLNHVISVGMRGQPFAEPAKQEKRAIALLARWSLAELRQVADLLPTRFPDSRTFDVYDVGKRAAGILAGLCGAGPGAPATKAEAGEPAGAQQEKAAA